MSSTAPSWIRQLQILYVVTISIWFAGLVAVIFIPQFGLSRVANLVLMAQVAPWVIYFVVASQRLRWMDEARAERSAAVIFILQRITGMIALVIAIAVAVAAAGSYPDYYGNTLLDKWSEPAGIADTIPYTMPFVCAGTFVVAEVLNFRKRRSAKIAVTSTAAENATS